VLDDGAFQGAINGLSDEFHVTSALVASADAVEVK
jgi:hypothetical protein